MKPLFRFGLFVLIYMISSQAGFAENSRNSAVFSLENRHANLVFSQEDELDAAITVSATQVCKNGAQPVITFTATSDTVPYTFTYTVNGGSSQTISTSGTSNSVMLSAPVNAAGIFVYSLDSVSSLNEPAKAVSKTVTITVHDLPTIDFSFPNNQCSSSPLTFTSTVSGGTSFSYLWNFGDEGTSTAANPSHLFTANGAGNQNFTVILTVTNNNGCSQTIQKNVTVKQSPDPSLTSDQNSQETNGIRTFRNCSNSSTLFTFYNASQTSSTNTSYTINWGDGTPDFTSATWSSITHNYAIGLWTLTYTITGSNGCVITKIYKVFVGSNPGVGIPNPGNTDICAGTTLTFPITGTDNNPPGTTYTVFFGDGASTSFVHPAPASVSHTYTTSSCGLTTPDGTANAFYVRIVASNPCQETPGTTAVRVSAPPKADFTVSKTKTCTNTALTFTQTISSAAEISGSSCNTTPKKVWKITPSTGYTLGSGSSLGNDFGLTNPNPWINGSDLLQVTFTVPGTYTVSLKSANGCGSSEKDTVICVESPLVPSFTMDTTEGCIPLTVATTNTTVDTTACEPPVYQWSVSYAQGNCGTSSGWSYAQGSTATSKSPVFQFTNPGIYTVRMAVSSACGVQYLSQTVSVYKVPEVTIQTISDYCDSANIVPVATIKGCGTSESSLSYSWNFPGGNPASSTLANPGTIRYSTPGNYTVSLAVTNSCGSSSVATRSFTVKASPKITNATLTDTVCSGKQSQAFVLTSDMAGTTFSCTVTATSGISGYYVPLGQITTIPARTINNSGSTQGTITYTITPKNGTCTGKSVQYTIVVYPSPQITTQPISSVVCLNGIATTMTVAYANGVGTPSYQWYSNTVNTNTTGTPIAGTTNSTYNPPTDVAGTVYYYCIITLSPGGCSSLISQPAFVTVNPLPVISLQPVATQQVCEGGSITAPLTVSYSGGTGTPSYQWYFNTANANTGGTLIPGATAASYTPPAFSTSGQYYYYVEVSLSGDGCGSAASNPAEVVVVPDPVIDSQPLISQTLCLSATADSLIVAVSGGIGSYSYQWYSNVSNNTTSGTAIGGATQRFYIPPASGVGTLYYYCEVTQPNGEGCSVISQTSEVIVNPSPYITTQPVSSVVCLDGAASAMTVAYVNGVGTPSYQWYSNTVNANTGGTALPNDTAAIYNPPTSTVGTVYYYCEITLPSGGCSTLVSQPASITVNPLPVISLQPVATQQVCEGGSITAPLTVSYSGGTGTPSYQWYFNTANANTGGTLIPGATAANYTPPAFSTSGQYYYYVEITFSGSGCGLVASNPAEVVVVPDPVIDSQPLTSQTLCLNATADSLIVAVSGGIGSYSYQWYSNSSNNTTSGTAISGATQSFYIPPASTVGTLYYYCVVTQTGGGCSVTSQTSQIIVNPSPSITNQPASSIVCLNGAASAMMVTYSNGIGTPSYQWYFNTANSNVGGTAIQGATNSTYNPPTDAIGSVYYYCEITLPSGGCSNLVSQPASVKVNPWPVITVQPTATQQVCEGGSITAPLTVSYSGGTGTPSYQWYFNTANANTGGTLIPGATAANYTPPAFSTNGQYYYYVEITFSGSGCGLVASNPAEVVVVPDPVIDSQPLILQTLCLSATADSLIVAVSGGIGSYSYQWYSNVSNNTTSGTAIGGATQRFYIPPVSSVGTLYYYCEVTQPNGEGCSVISQTSEVIVNPSPYITTQPVSSVVCLDGAASAMTVAYVNGVGTPSYQWYSNTINANTGGTALPNDTAATYNPPTSTVGTVYYYCEITLPSGGCSNLISQPASVTVYPYPVISPDSILIGSGQTFLIIPPNNISDIVPVGTTYTWSAPVVNPAGSITGSSAEVNPQTSISQTLTNTSTGIATVTYTVTPVSGICTGVDFNIVVTVTPPINANVTINAVSCHGLTDGSLIAAISGGQPFGTGSPYIISWTGPNGFSSNNASVSGLAPGVYQLQITDANGLTDTNSYTIIEPEEILVTVNQQNDITCFGASDGLIDITVTGGTGNYQYIWKKNSLPFATTEDISGLSPGTYTVTVTDANGCGPVTGTYTLSEPDPLEVRLLNKTDVVCFGDLSGIINVNITGGTPVEISSGQYDYLYQWTGSNGFVSNNKNTTNLPAGNYTLTVTDQWGCYDTLHVSISQPDELIIDTLTTPITCYGADNASISIAVTGGVSPYQIQWSNLGAGMKQENLSAGNYTITVVDAAGCVKTTTVTIPEATVFKIDPIVKQISCYGAHDGSINLNITAINNTVNLAWSDFSPAGNERNNLSPGTYSVIITNVSTGCVINQSFVILEPDTLVISAQLTHALDCNDVNSGAIDLTVNGGTQPYSYFWSNGAASADLVNIPSGSYFATVTDANGCSATGQYVITRSSPLDVSITTALDFNCEEQHFQEVCTAQISGGVAPYQLSWSTGTTGGTFGEVMITNQTSTAILEVTDAMGCKKSVTFNTEVPKLEISYQVLDCNNRIYLFDVVIPDLLLADCTYLWNFGDGNNSTDKNPQHTFDVPGTYKIRLDVTISSCTVTLEQNIVVESLPVLSLDKEVKLCRGDSVTIYALGADSYVWFDGTKGDSIVIRRPGNYMVTGTSANGCIAALNFTASYFDEFNYQIFSDKDVITPEDPTIRFWTEDVTFSSYKWDFGDGTTDYGNSMYHTYNIQKGGYIKIKLQVTNPYGCVEEAVKQIWISLSSLPNTFTPNGDGVNDIFMSGWHIQVYNRNAILLYEGTDGWDGTYNGKPVANGTYFFVILYQSSEGTQNKTGFITVVR